MENIFTQLYLNCMLHIEVYALEESIGCDKKSGYIHMRLVKKFVSKNFNEHLNLI
jgi:hypothetical protein